MIALVATARLEVRLLGRFELRLEGLPVHLPSRPAQSLLAYLALTAGTVHRREKLAAMLWPDADEENARTYLRQALWRIRKVTAGTLPSDIEHIVSDDLTVGLDATASCWLDVIEFERPHQGAGADALIARLALYGGELLPGFYDEWVIRERERLEAVVSVRMEELLDLLSADRRWPELIDWAERWISLCGTPERAYRALMLAHHERGDRARMAAAFRRCAQALKRDLDVEPSDETRHLYQRLTASAGPAIALPAAVAPIIDLAAGTAGSEDPPFKGLPHFDEDDADLFFGREELVTRIADRLRQTSFLAIVGASGSGKSSLLRAGLLPALRSRGSVHVLTPTARPLEALAAGLTADSTSTRAMVALLDDLAADARSLRLHLRKRGGRTFLLVDQFEELFTLCRDPFEREAFIDDLLGAALPDGEAAGTVVIALRADFYAHCADHAGLRDALADHQAYIGPMDPGEMRRAIEGPASTRGWEIEQGLVDLVLHDVGDEPGALPLLSHALLATWQRRRGRALTLEGYAAAGGVRGAIAHTAESVFERLTAPRQQLARRIFLRLTEFGEGTQDTRRRVSIDELRSSSVDPAAVSDVLQILADARLISMAERTVDVAHEALIREWPRLRRWLDEDREALRAHRELTRSALDWDRVGRDPGALYRGARLAQAQDVATQIPEELNELERAFVSASRAQAEAEEHDREAARQRELESARTLATAERTAATKLRQRALYLTLALFFLAGMAGAAVFFAEQARGNAAAVELEQRHVLLENAKAVATNVDARLGALRDAVSHPGLVGRLSYQTRASDPQVPQILNALWFSHTDVTVVFMVDYERNEIAVMPFLLDRGSVYTPPEARMRRADRARVAVVVAAPEAAANCRRIQDTTGVSTRDALQDELSPLYVSAPYSPGPGEPPAIAIAKYNQPCLPYALVQEVTLRQANEWMVTALAPGDDAYLVDATGRLLAQARRATADHFRDLSGSHLVASSLASKDPAVRNAEDPLTGEARLTASAPVRDTGWRVIVVRAASPAQTQLEADLAQLRVIGVLLVLLLIGASVVALAVRRSRPL